MFSFINVNYFLLNNTCEVVMLDFKKLIGKRIQIIRKSRKLTQEKLAELIKIETPSLSYLETGKYAPSVETLQKLSEVLQADPCEFYRFFTRSEEEMKQEILKGIEKNPKLLDIMYKFYKSVEY